MKIIKCEMCGEEFEKVGKRIYCSKVCATKARNQAFLATIRDTKRIITCPICDKEFEPLQGNSKYCSDECRRIAKLRAKDDYVKSTVRSSMTKYALKSHVTETVKAAKEAGMSYGQYKAIQYMKQQKEAENGL